MNNRDLITRYGFEWGPMTVTRMIELEGRGRVVGIDTANRRLQIHVSEKGQRIRVWLDGEQLK